MGVNVLATGASVSWVPMLRQPPTHTHSQHLPLALGCHFPHPTVYTELVSICLPVLTELLKATVNSCSVWQGPDVYVQSN